MTLSEGYFVHTAGPNTALIKSTGRNKVRVVIGGRMISIPGLERVDALSLELRTITVYTKSGLTINGVSVDVTSACQVKIQGWKSDGDASTQPSGNGQINVTMDEAAIRLAAQHFLGKTDEEIEDSIQRTIAGHQRSIIGSLTLEELYRDRAAFCKQVLDLISIDMRNMGLAVVSYTVAEISDENGYIEALGVTQTEIVKREAMEGAAIHQAAATSKSAMEEANAHLRVNEERKKKIESDKQLQIEQAKAQEQVDRQKAIQDKAHDISTAEQDAILFTTRQKAKAAEIEAELLVLQQLVAKEKLVKLKSINVEADANLYKAKVNADSLKIAANAQAEQLKLIGQAEAEAIRVKGLAEVEILQQRNKAWQESVNSGAILEKIVDILPSIAQAVSLPLQKTEKMVFVNSGTDMTGNSSGGASSFVKDFKRTVAEVPEVVHALTGISMKSAMQNLASGETKSALIQGIAEGVSSSIAQKSLE